jgi:hypothetical protein
MSRRWLELRDINGAVSPQINGVDVDHFITLYRGLSYHATGAIIDAVGKLSVQLPLTDPAAKAADIGTHILVHDSDYSDPVAHAIVSSKATTIQDGPWVQLECDDLLGELGKITVTSGYATPVATGEPLALTVQRLADMKRTVFDSTAPAWTSTCDITTLDGLDFLAMGVSSFQALDKLREERHAHLKRGPERLLKFGRFFAGSGFQPSGYQAKRPTAGSWRVSDGSAPEILLIDPGSFNISNDGQFINDMTAFGSGNGDDRLDLSFVYYADKTQVVGYDYAHPVKRRYRLDGGGIDTMEYYLDDPTSKSVRGWSMQQIQHNDIGAASGNPNAMLDASASLYQAVLAELIWNSVPDIRISFRTIGNGNPIDLAGKTLHVQWFEHDSSGARVITVDDDYYILEVKCSPTDDGVMYWDWIVSSQARWDATTNATITGALQDIRSLSNTPMIYPDTMVVGPLERDLAGTDQTGAAVSFDITIPADLRQISVKEAVFVVTPVHLQSTATTAIGGQHQHTINIPVLSTPAFTSSTDHAHATSGGGHGHTASAADHAHATSVGAHAHGATLSGGTSTNAAGTGSLMNAFNTHYHTMLIASGGTPGDLDHGGYLYVGGGPSHIQATAGKQIQASTDPGIGYSSIVTDHSHSSSTSGSTAGNGAFSQGSTGAGAFNNATTGYGGFALGSSASGAYSTFTNTNATTIATTSADPGHIHALAYGLYQGPLPTGMTLWVDGVQLTQGFNTRFTVDIWNYINNQSAHTVQVRAATLGRVQVVGYIHRTLTNYRANIA